ncbi:MAG: class I SAM-dependent methyltransferase [Actinomycetota bacterium]
MADLREAYLTQAADLEAPVHWSGPPEMVDRIAAIVGTRPDHLVVDVGAGVGGPARRLAELVGCRVIAVDLLPELVARIEAPPGPGTVRGVAGTATALPFADRVADQIWCLGMVAHLPDLGAFAREVRRAMRPGGALAVTEAFADHQASARFAASAPRPWRALPTEELVHALHAAGLVSVEVHTWPGHGIPGALKTRDPLLSSDLAEGRLTPRLVLAR